MDKFDELSNNELREQLKSLGLGNFPVTDTTRNALIKKLRTAVNGPAKPAVAKNRRETMNTVVKNPSPNEYDANTKNDNKPKTPNNRRATIAAGAVNMKPVVILNGIPNEKDATKSVPLVISNDKTPIKPVAVRPKSPARPKSPSRRTIIAPEPIAYFADASDDDLVAAAEEAEKKVTRKSRSSRSPSLSKSQMVTTSYKHTIEPLIESRDDDDAYLLNDISDAEYNSEMLHHIRKPSTPTTKITSHDIDNRRKTMHVGPSISTNFSSIKPIEKPYEDSSSSAYRRRVTTYTSPSYTKNIDDRSSEDVLGKVETPFLSDFTRRLAQLKAEELPGISVGYKTPKSLTSDYSKEYRSSAYGTNRAADRYRQNTLAKKTPSKWSVLEKQLRWPLLITLTLFCAVFVYVFFFSNY